MYFGYGEEETRYLKGKCKKLSSVMDKVGHIKREVDRNLFSSVVRHIAGQQISTKAQATVWQRINDDPGDVNAGSVIGAGIDKSGSFGMSFRKAEYIFDFACKVKNGEFDLEAIREKSDEETIAALSH